MAAVLLLLQLAGWPVVSTVISAMAYVTATEQNFGYGCIIQSFQTLMVLQGTPANVGQVV